MTRAQRAHGYRTVLDPSVRSHDDAQRILTPCQMQRGDWCAMLHRIPMKRSTRRHAQKARRNQDGHRVRLTATSRMVHHVGPDTGTCSTTITTGAAASPPSPPSHPYLTESFERCAVRGLSTGVSATPWTAKWKHAIQHVRQKSIVGRRRQALLSPKPGVATGITT